MISSSKFQASNRTASGLTRKASSLETIGTLVPGVSLPDFKGLLSAMHASTLESRPAKFNRVELLAEAPNPMILPPAD
jgi:hypothetical protein